jgi:hypothetical protein
MVRRHQLGGRTVAAVLVALVSAGSLLASVLITSSAAPTAYFSVQTRAWEFGVGALVALTSSALARIRPAVAAMLSWLGLALIVTAVTAYTDATPFPGRAALLPVLGGGLVIAVGCGRPARASADAVLSRGPAQLVGRLSYGWYLWHWPVLVLAPTILGQALSRIDAIELSLLSLWLAGVTYVVIEVPLTRRSWSTRRWLIRAVIASALVAAAALVVSMLAPAVVGTGHRAAPINLAGDNLGQLTQDLATAALTQAVPDDLTPTLTAAAGDVPSTEVNCHLGFLATVEGACIYGDASSTKTVVLSGDSHAQQWQGALEAAATALHWRLVSWTKAACPVADVVVDNAALKRSYSECDEFRSTILNRINALHPTLIIASQSDVVPGRSVDNATWARQTARTLGQLEHPGTAVVFVADTPAPKDDVPTCVAAHLSDVTPCEVNRRDAYESSAYYADRHEQVNATLRADGVVVDDPIDWLCASSICPVIVGDTLVYRDDSHLTNTFSVLLAPLLERILQEPGVH